VSPTVVAVFIAEGAHHLDLMFSHPDDPKSVTDARKVEKRHIERWVREYGQKVQSVAFQ
jgi:lysosomal Pro-X carboxypeptidase